jgi:hypothetical protein
MTLSPVAVEKIAKMYLQKWWRRREICFSRNHNFSVTDWAKSNAKTVFVASIVTNRNENLQKVQKYVLKKWWRRRDILKIKMTV